MFKGSSTLIVLPVLISVGLGAGYLGVRNYVKHSKPASENRPAKKTSPVVVELFTSEGCSSCPPADQLLSRLKTSQPISGAEIIALEEHVTYWDRLGWRDPFSSDLLTERQKGYSARFGSGVYTPQMIVGGNSELVGSDNRQARIEIAAAADNAKAEVKLSTANQPSQSAGATALEVTATHVPSITAGDHLEVVVATTQDGVNSNVTSGENAGRNLVHNSVVRTINTIAADGVVDAGGNLKLPTPVTVPQDSGAGNLNIVVLLQERTSRRILGAAVQSSSNRSGQ